MPRNEDYVIRIIGLGGTRSVGVSAPNLHRAKPATTCITRIDWQC